MNPKVFSSFSDALMAGLASRSHEWMEWEIRETEQFSSDSPSHLQIFLTTSLATPRFLKSPAEKDVIALTLFPGQSPSACVEKALQKKRARSRSISFPPGELEWNPGVPEVFDWEAIFSQKLKSQMGKLPLEKAHVEVSRIKNSRGFLESEAHLCFGKQKYRLY